MSDAGADLRVEWLGRVAYHDALARQESLVAAKIAVPDSAPDTLLLLEHDPVYTMAAPATGPVCRSPPRFLTPSKRSGAADKGPTTVPGSWLATRSSISVGVGGTCTST